MTETKTVAQGQVEIRQQRLEYDLCDRLLASRLSLAEKIESVRIVLADLESQAELLRIWATMVG